MADDLADVARDLYAASSLAQRETEQVVKKGALNIKRDWRRRWHDPQNLPRLKYSIGFDVYAVPGSVLAVIGPDADMDTMQGPLGGVLEFGTVNNPPHPGGLPSLLAEEDAFVEHLGAMGQDLIEGRKPRG